MAESFIAVAAFDGRSDVASVPDPSIDGNPRISLLTANGSCWAIDEVTALGSSLDGFEVDGGAVRAWGTSFDVTSGSASARTVTADC